MYKKGENLKEKKRYSIYLGIINNKYGYINKGYWE